MLKWLILILPVISCGLQNYKHVESKTDLPRPGLRSDREQTCKIAELAFQGELEILVEGKCLNCHADGRSAGPVFSFETGQRAKNVDVLSNLMGGDADKIFAKASGAISHGGGQQMLPENRDALGTFFKAVSLCEEG